MSDPKDLLHANKVSGEAWGPSLQAMLAMVPKGCKSVFGQLPLNHFGTQTQTLALKCVL